MTSKTNHATKTRTLGREVFNASVLKTKRLKVPEWDGEIIVRELSAAQTAELAAFGPTGDVQLDPHSALRVAAWAVVAAWVDEEGSPVLTSADIDMLLSTQTPDVINRLASEIMGLSGMAPKALEVAAKNSVSSQSDDSGTH